MGAGLGFKTFVTGDVLTAADTNGYLMQGTWVFATAAARDAAVTSPQEGNMCYLKDTDAVQYYSGSAWTAVAGASGSLTLLSTTSITAVSTTISSISQSYKNLLIYVKSLQCSSVNPTFAISPNSATNFFGSEVRGRPTASVNYINGTGLTDGGAYSNSNGAKMFNVLTIYDYANATNSKTVTYSESYYNSSGEEVGSFYSGKLNSSSAISSILLSVQAGATAITGTCQIYGVN